MSENADPVRDVVDMVADVGGSRWWSAGCGVRAFAIPDASSAAKVLSVVLGVLALIVGVLCLRSPQQTVVVLTLVLGAFWLIHGVVDIVAGIGGRGEAGRGWTIVGGVIGVLGGIV